MMREFIGLRGSVKSNLYFRLYLRKRRRAEIGHHFGLSDAGMETIETQAGD
jgi:hypothetical protein